MPKVTMYIRVEDAKKWKKIGPGRADMIHRAIQAYRLPKRKTASDFLKPEATDTDQ